MKTKISIAVCLLSLSFSLLSAETVILVQDFENLGGNEKEAWIGKGISLALSHKLQNINTLVIMEKDGPSVSVLAKGSFQKQDKQIRISAKLTDKKEGKVINSFEVTGPMDSLFILQDRIAEKIAASFNAKITTNEKPAQPANVAALQKVVEGKKHEEGDGVKKDLKKAKALYIEALELDSNLIEARERIGDVCAEMGKAKESQNAYKEVITVQPNNAAAHEKLGDAYEAQGATKLSVDEYAQVIKLMPGNSRGYEKLGRAYKKLEKRDEAEKYLNKALAINQDRPESHALLGDIFQERGQIISALKEYETAEKLGSENAVMYSNFGTALHAQGKYKGALDKYKKSHDLDPDDGINDYNTACTYSMMGKPKKGLPFLKSAVKKGFRKWKVIDSDTDLANVRKLRAYQAWRMRQK